MYPKWEKLAPDVYAYVQKGLGRSNAGVIVREDDVVLVDTVLNKQMVDGLIENLARTTAKPVRLIINTHYHTDHVCTNHFFPEATVICSAACREQMRLKGKAELEGDKQLFPDEDWEGAEFTLPDVSFERSLTVYDGDREIRAIDLGAAHTEADAIVHLPEQKIVFCGDLVLSGLPPAAMGGSLSGLIESLDYLLGLDADVYVPGHGPVGGKEAVALCHEHSVLVRTEARKCFDAGMSCEEACKTMNMGRFSGIPSLASPAALAMTVPRAYAEFRGEAPGSHLVIDWEIDFSQMMAE